MYDLILNFTVRPMWVPKGMDENEDEPLAPVGINNNMLPIDRNVTFIFDWKQGKHLAVHTLLWASLYHSCFNILTLGTIENIVLVNTTGGADIFLGNFTVTDKFNAKDFRVNIPFQNV